MTHDNAPQAGTLKQRVLEALKVYGIITLYLWLSLGLFTVYRRLVLAETGTTYLHYGVALVEAMIIAKVVLVGRMFGFSRRFEDRALIVPVAYKSLLFGLLVLLFGVLEHLVGGWLHRRGMLGGLHEIAEVGTYELAARTLMMMVAFVPFFAFTELGRVLGTPRLAALFFASPVDSAADAAASAREQARV